MSIVLNERSWTEEMITSRSLGKKPFETMRRVARYYLDNGIPKREVRRMMDSFLLQCDPTASLPKWAGALDSALLLAGKYESINIDGIAITAPEMKRIERSGGRQIQRLAFTLLCLSKYWNAVTKSSEGWVNSNDSDIMRMANINTSIKRQSLMYHTLNEAGMIRFSKKVDNTNVQVCFEEPGETVLYVTDFRNLGYQYMMYHGGDFFVCTNCGITTKNEKTSTRGPKQKYCRECALQVKMQQNVNSVMRSRGRRTTSKQAVGL